MFTQLQSWLNETLTAGKKARRVDRDGRRFRPSLTVLEDRTVPSTIVWANRDLPDNQGGSGFNAFFGADAERAKGVVDAALHAWEKVIQSFNFPLEPRVFISMGSDAGFGASASERTYFGHPVEGTITINRGGAGPDGGWFLDPRPCIRKNSVATWPRVKAWETSSTLTSLRRQRAAPPLARWASAAISIRLSFWK